MPRRKKMRGENNTFLQKDKYHMIALIGGIYKRKRGAGYK